MNVLIAQLIIVIILAFIIIYLYKYNRSLKLEKRISKYSFDSVKDNSISFLDLLFNSYQRMLVKLSKVFKKSEILKKYSSRYEKYITYEENKTTISMDYISNKFLIGILFFMIILLARVIMGKMPSFYECVLAFTFGFFIIDIYFIFYDKIKKKRIEQDLLNAIIIMNNAFRSGRSVMQAIEIVSTELKGPIKEEFKKMFLEINYGLSLDVVFERFSKRVESSEVSYITSSLSILNKTGGNIINVFASIEKMLFDKRKLKEEMKSLTSSSNMISKFLLILPFIFVVLISFLSPGYFMPLISTSLGRILLSLIIVLYIIYAIIINKLMKVRF